MPTIDLKSPADGRLAEGSAPPLRDLMLRPVVAPVGPERGAAAEPLRGAVLVVDDFEANRRTVLRHLKMQGHAVTAAENGREALALLRERPFDLVLLDIVMPELDGYQVLEQIRADPRLRHIPVVVISGVEDLSSIVRCIELGAVDYLFKPFEPVLLRARVTACLESKRLRDQEQAFLRQLQAEQTRSDSLLLNILPQPIAERLKRSQGPIAEHFDDVTVLFADLVGFTGLADRLAPAQLVGLLDEIFSIFDDLAEQHGLEKIKTIGDAYMAAGGLRRDSRHHADAVADMALAMQAAIAAFSERRGEPYQLRLGISSGPAVAGVIGRRKFIYDLWGDTVNTAARMESHGITDEIQVSDDTAALLRERFTLVERGRQLIKGKGSMSTWLLVGERPRS